MSDQGQPTLGDVLGAVQAVVRRLDSLGGKIGALDGTIGALDRKVAALDSKVGRTKFELMGRMDRLQDKVTEQVGNADVPLEVLSTNQKIAEGSLSEARLSLDQYGSLARAVTGIEQQIVRLQRDVQELRDRQ
jgi:hypothetical protein